MTGLTKEGFIGILQKYAFDDKVEIANKEICETIIKRVNERIDYLDNLRPNFGTPEYQLYVIKDWLIKELKDLIAPLLENGVRGIKDNDN